MSNGGRFPGRAAVRLNVLSLRSMDSGQWQCVVDIGVPIMDVGVRNILFVAHEGWC